MLRAHKTRIRNANPGSSIARALSQHDGATRWVYNALLVRLNDAAQAASAGALWPSVDDLVSRVNYICRFTSSAWPRCWAASVR